MIIHSVYIKNNRKMSLCLGGILSMSSIHKNKCLYLTTSIQKQHFIHPKTVYDLYKFTFSFCLNFILTIS
jgi:hypothetical protein